MRKTFILITSLLTVIGLKAQASEPVSYRSPIYVQPGTPSKGISGWETLDCSTYTELATSMTTWGIENEDSWYVVNKNLSFSSLGIECKGNVNLILCDGAQLTVSESGANKAGIRVTGSNSLTIYGQSGQTGKLIVSVSGGGIQGAAIGGKINEEGCNITINGGVVEATVGGWSGAAIGGGMGAKATNGGDGHDIVINEGTVKANCYDASAAIGGGYSDNAQAGHGYNIVINGGKLSAVCNDAAGQGHGGACIGGGGAFQNGTGGDGYNITINGGTISAKSGDGLYSHGAGIGAGYGQTNGGYAHDIRINDGIISAKGGEDESASAIGRCFNGPDSKDIYINKLLIVQADNNRIPIDVISHESDEDLSEKLSNRGFATIYPLIILDEKADKAVNKGIIDELMEIGDEFNIKLLRTFYKDGGHNTICLPFSLNEDQLAASPLAGCRLQTFVSAEVTNPGKDYETMTLTLADTTAIKAGRPYIISWTSGEDIKDPIFYNVTVTENDSYNTVSDDVTFQGNLYKTPVTAYDKRIMFVNSGNTLNWPDVNNPIYGFRSYFIINLDPKSAVNPKMKVVLAPNNTRNTK